MTLVSTRNLAECGNASSMSSGGAFLRYFLVVKRSCGISSAPLEKWQDIVAKCLRTG